MVFILQCAWCERVLGTQGVQSEVDEPKSISHTICAECSAAVLKEIHGVSHEKNEYYLIP